MSEFLEINATDLIKLRRFYKKSPKKFNLSMVNLINSFAFETRKEALKVIHKEMNITNQSFVVSRMRVKTATLSRMVSSSGSIRSKRFSGWEEQEYGKKTKRTKTSSLVARGGKESGQLMTKYRMKPGREFMSPDDFEGKHDEHRLAAMLRHIEHEKYKKPFIIRTGKKFTKGMYVVHRKKIKLIQKFKNRVQPKRIKWMTKARNNMFSKNNTRDMWANSIKRTVKFK